MLLGPLCNRRDCSERVNAALVPVGGNPPPSPPDGNGNENDENDKNDEDVGLDGMGWSGGKRRSVEHR